MKKISLFNLSDLASRENVATKVVRNLDKPTASALFSRGLILPCPDVNKVRSTSHCVDCPYFKGVGYVQINGEAPLQNKFRVMCSMPTHRSLSPSSSRKTQEYKDELTHSVKNLTPEEKAIFIDGGVAVNCPLSRAKTGNWRLEHPPCPACKYYGGLKAKESGPGILCSHVKSIRITRPTKGSMGILEEITNASTE